MPDAFRELPSGLQPRTIMARGGHLRSQFMETCEAVYMSSGYVYKTAEEAESAFTNDGSRFVYSRYANPTVAMFEERLRLLEGAEACRATASGMAAVFAALACQVKAGDRVVASRALFNSCNYIITQILPRYGVVTELVDGRDLKAWEKALAPGVKAVFCESPSNPTLELIDIAAVAALTHRAGGVLIVDNVFATPLLQRPLQLGADIVVYSATKHIDGQGRSLGGAVLGSDGLRAREPDAVPAPHRPGAEPVQCLAPAQGHRDARSARRAAMPLGGRGRAIPRAPPEDRARALSRPREPSAIPTGAPADERAEHAHGALGQGRQDRRLPLPERAPADRDLEQSGRRQDASSPIRRPPRITG